MTTNTSNLHHNTIDVGGRCCEYFSQGKVIDKKGAFVLSNNNAVCTCMTFSGQISSQCLVFFFIVLLDLAWGFMASDGVDGAKGIPWHKVLD